MYGIKEKSFSNPKVKAFIGCLSVLAFFILIMVLSPDHGGLINRRINEKLRIDFLNVGEGDSILLRTPMGKVFLIDGGPGKQNTASGFFREDVCQYLIGQGIRNLDGVIITHWHSDHIIGLLNVLKRVSIDCVYEPPYSGKGQVYEDFDRIANLVKLKRVKIHSEQVLNCGDELFIQILNPDENQDIISYSEQNDSSVVLLIRYGKVQTLLCADIEKTAMKEIMKYGDAIKSQIVKVPNHGSLTGDYKPFIKLVGAKTAIVSVGENNSLGHPSLKVLDIYKNSGATVYQTSVNGTIKAVIGGKTEEDYIIQTSY